MTRKQLLERVEFWRARLAPELRVAFMDHPPPGDEAEDFLGIVQTDWRISESRIYFTKDLRTRDPHEIDRVIVHELVHPLLDRVLDTDEVLEAHVPPAVWKAYRETRLAALEHFTDRIARAIADPENSIGPAFGTWPGRKKGR